MRGWSSPRPAFSAGHDLSEMIGREPSFYEELFAVCTEMMTTIQRIPQPVIARVHGVATAAGCQLVASCDLAVASTEAWFATPGVKIGLFCTTPAVPLVRAIGRKRAMEMLLTARPVDAATALEWGLVTGAPEELDAVDEYVETSLLQRARDRPARAFYRQVGLPSGRTPWPSPSWPITLAPPRPGGHVGVPGEAPARLAD